MHRGPAAEGHGGEGVRILMELDGEEHRGHRDEHLLPDDLATIAGISGVESAPTALRCRHVRIGCVFHRSLPEQCSGADRSAVSGRCSLRGTLDPQDPFCQGLAQLRRGRHGCIECLSDDLD